MQVDVPTPPDGSQTQRSRRSVPNSVKVALPMSVIASLCLIALGWVWNTDKAQALDHQSQESLKKEHDELKTTVRQDLRDLSRKLDEVKDLILRK